MPTPSSPSFLTPSSTPSIRFQTSADSGEVVNPFQGVSLVDPGTDALETLTAQVESFGARFGDPNSFSGTGSTAEGTGQFGTLYVATGTVAQINADLASATFSDTIRTLSASETVDLDTITLSDIGSVAGTTSATGTIYGGVVVKTILVNQSTPVLTNSDPTLSIAAGAKTIYGALSSISLSDSGSEPTETLTAVVPAGFLEAPGFSQTTSGTYVATGSVAQVNGDLQDAELRVFGPGTYSIAVSDTGSVLGVASAHPATTLETIVVAPCFATGTMIQTEAGEVAVEALQIGDRVRTASGGLRPIRWLGHRRVDCRRHPEPEKVRPVRVRAHAFGDDLPARDLVLSPEHALFLDGHLVPVGVLVDGVSVVQEAWERVTYHHVELDRHDVILAEGLAAESYLDTGNRGQFSNAPVVALYPEFGAGSEAAEACAPLLLAGRHLETLRAGLVARWAMSSVA